MRVRSGLLVIAVVGATLVGSAAASAAIAPDLPDVASPEWTEECLAHHSELTEEELAAMHDAMESGSFGAMASTMGADWGSMAPMMGGGMGHHGWDR